MSAYLLSNLKKRFGDKQVLDIDSLVIERGRILCLLGPNGAGKTTLLKILAFIESPTDGQVLYNGKTVHYVPSILQPLRRRVVMLNQEPVLFTTSVYKNIEFGLKIRGITSKKRRHLIDEVLELVGMRNFIQARADRLSGGEARRISLARALVLSPQVMLCDEPTASVDVENQFAIFNILKRINEKKGTTLVLTTHDRFHPFSFTHHNVFLNQGKLSSPSVQNIYSGSVDSIKEGRGMCCIQKTVILDVPATNKGEVRLMLDPTQLKLVDNEGERTNTLQGRVVQIGEDNGHIKAVIDAQIYLTMLIPAEQYRSQPVIVGQSVIVEIPDDAIRLM